MEEGRGEEGKWQRGHRLRDQAVPPHSRVAWLEEALRRHADVWQRRECGHEATDLA